MGSNVSVIVAVTAVVVVYFMSKSKKPLPISQTASSSSTPSSTKKDYKPQNTNSENSTPMRTRLHEESSTRDTAAQAAQAEAKFDESQAGDLTSVPTTGVFELFIANTLEDTHEENGYVRGVPGIGPVGWANLKKHGVHTIWHLCALYVESTRDDSKSANRERFVDLLTNCDVRVQFADRLYSALSQKFGPTTAGPLAESSTPLLPANGRETVMDKFMDMNMVQIHQMLEENGYQAGVPGIAEKSWQKLASPPAPIIDNVFRLLAAYFDLNQETFCELLKAKGIVNPVPTYTALSAKFNRAT